MHSFTELVDRGTAFTLEALREAENKTIEALQTSGATSLVKTLQMVRMQKAVLAIGMFSLFEATLQDRLECKDGFQEATRILESAEEPALREAFLNLCCAINVLKHGHGRSYDTLVAKAGDLPFRIKMPGEDFFFEGDVSEISVLIDADDSFVQGCADVIRGVTGVIQKVRKNFV